MVACVCTQFGSYRFCFLLVAPSQLCGCFASGGKVVSCSRGELGTTASRKPPWGNMIALSTVIAYGCLCWRCNCVYPQAMEVHSHPLIGGLQALGERYRRCASVGCYVGHCGLSAWAFPVGRERPFSVSATVVSEAAPAAHLQVSGLT